MIWCEKDVINLTGGCAQMSLKIFDFECEHCQVINEMMVDSSESPICEKCGTPLTKVFITSGGHRLPEDTSWLPSVLEVVDKDSKAPHVTEFLRNPTRTNYRAWMKGEGIAPLERGERPHRPTEKEERETSDKRARILARNLQQRRSITIGR
jgi:hypothetical protein